MFQELVEDPGGFTATELHERYLDILAGIVGEYGIGAVAETASVETATLRALESGETPELTLEEAASVLAAADEAPDAETIAALARDELLMGMTTAVLDVEAVESGLGGELEAKEIHSKIEGRYPMTLREFALLYAHIDGET